MKKYSKTSSSEKKLKILISLTYYLPNISGVTIYAQRLAKEMAKRGHRVTILTSHHHKKTQKTEIKNNLNIIREKVHFKIGKGAIMLNFPLTAFKLAKQHDVINCHLPQFEAVFLALAAKIYRKKLFVTYHTDLPGWGGIKNTFQETIVKISHTVSCSLANKIITNTKDYALTSSFLKEFKGKLIHVYPPIEIENPKTKNIQKIKSKISKKDIIIGFSGRVAREKGIVYLLKAIPRLEKHLTKFKIALAGPYKTVIGEQFYKEIESLAKKYSQKIIFLGSLSSKDFFAFNKLVDVLVLPSTNRLESFGMVQVEAMMLGTPVVATNLPGVRIPITKTGMGKLVPPKNPKKLAKAIIEVINNHKKHYRTKNKIKKHFSSKKTFDFYERLFQ